MDNDCLFCRIARLEFQVHEIFRNDRVIAFLDNAPIRTGHAQIIPVSHFEYFDALPSVIAHEIMDLAQKVAIAQKELLHVERVRLQ